MPILPAYLAAAECGPVLWSVSRRFLPSTMLVFGRYEARGLFLDPPTAGLTRGRWQLRMPDGPLPNVPASELAFDSVDDMFDSSRWLSALLRVAVVSVHSSHPCPMC